MAEILKLANQPTKASEHKSKAIKVDPDADSSTAVDVAVETILPEQTNEKMAEDEPTDDENDQDDDDDDDDKVNSNIFRPFEMKKMNPPSEIRIPLHCLSYHGCNPPSFELIFPFSARKARSLISTPFHVMYKFNKTFDNRRNGPVDAKDLIETRE